MKMTNDDILDYVDGTLSPERMANMEAYLRSNSEEAMLARDMKEARAALLDWHESEPVRVSDDFWLKVRAQLPESGPRQSFARKVGAWLWPSHSRSGLSLRVAGLAGLAALATLYMFAPRQNAQPSYAKDTRPTTADLAFMSRATKQHNAFATTPDSVLAPVAPGDAGSQETGDNDDTEPQMP